MAVYPANIKGTVGYTWIVLADGSSYPTAQQTQDAYDEITAIETVLGTSGMGGDSVATRLATLEGGGVMSEGKKRIMNIMAVTPDLSNPPVQDFITGTNVETEVMWFGASADTKVHFNFTLPSDVDTTEDITVLIDCCISDAPSTGDVVELVMYYLPITASSTSLSSGATEQSTSDNYIVDGWTVGIKRTHSELTIPSTHLTAGYSYSCTLLRDVSEDDYANDFGITNIALKYTCKDPA